MNHDGDLWLVWKLHLKLRKPAYILVEKFDRARCNQIRAIVKFFPDRIHSSGVGK